MLLVFFPHLGNYIFLKQYHLEVSEYILWKVRRTEATGYRYYVCDWPIQGTSSSSTVQLLGSASFNIIPLLINFPKATTDRYCVYTDT